jgi:hypothetical protein
LDKDWREWLVWTAVSDEKYGNFTIDETNCFIPFEGLSSWIFDESMLSESGNVYIIPSSISQAPFL